jgi:hypothetical protein
MPRAYCCALAFVSFAPLPTALSIFLPRPCAIFVPSVLLKVKSRRVPTREETAIPRRCVCASWPIDARSWPETTGARLRACARTGFIADVVTRRASLRRTGPPSLRSSRTSSAWPST